LGCRPPRVSNPVGAAWANVRQQPGAGVRERARVVAFTEQVLSAAPRNATSDSSGCDEWRQLSKEYVSPRSSPSRRDRTMAQLHGAQAEPPDVRVHLHYADKPPEKGPFENIVALATSLSTLVALIVASLGLAFVIWPGWKPQGPPTKTGGTVAKVGVESNVTFGQHWRNIGFAQAPKPPSGGPVPPDNQIGYEVTARVDLAGDETHVYTVIATVFDAKTLRAYKPSKNARLKYWTQPQVLQPTVRDFSAGFRCWVAADLPRGKYLFRASLFDGGTPPERGQRKAGPGALIDFADSATYTVN